MTELTLCERMMDKSSEMKLHKENIDIAKFMDFDIGIIERAEDEYVGLENEYEVLTQEIIDTYNLQEDNYNVGGD